jgi:transcriptional regulator with XRE-family HTH domain
VKEDELLKLTLTQIGERLTELRKQLGYTSYETFAYDHEIPRMQYWRMEKGRVNITMKSLMRILTIHRITLAEFFVSIPLKRGR